MPSPSEVKGDPIPYIKAIAQKYSIELPSSFGWGYWDGPLPPPYNTDIYGATTPPYLGETALEPNTAYIDSLAFADLNEIEFASVMYHEARHAWLLHFIEHPGVAGADFVIEKLPPLNFVDPRYGPLWGIHSEADAFYMQGIFLRDHGASTTLPNVGDVFAKSSDYKDLLTSLTNTIYLIPLPYSQP